MDGTLSIVLQKDDTICVVDSNGKVCLETAVNVQKVLDLAKDGVIEVPNKYTITKLSSDVVQVEFMCDRLWVSEQTQINKLLTLALVEGW